MDDWEYSDESCPKCQSQLATRRCASCGGDRYTTQEDDDGSEFEEPCDNCNRTGHETWCRGCGWDMNFKCFLSPQYEQEWLAKQTSTSLSTQKEGDVDSKT